MQHIAIRSPESPAAHLGQAWARLSAGVPTPSRSRLAISTIVIPHPVTVDLPFNTLPVAVDPKFEVVVIAAATGNTGAAPMEFPVIATRSFGED